MLVIPLASPGAYVERYREPDKAASGLGEGAERWLILAAASGTERIRTKMRRATELAALVGAASVDEALALAAEAGRFAEGDLESILDHRRLMGDRASERLEPDDDTLQPGTGAWAGLGR